MTLGNRFCGYTAEEVLEMGTLWDTWRDLRDTPTYRSMLLKATREKIEAEIARLEVEDAFLMQEQRALHQGENQVHGVERPEPPPTRLGGIGYPT